MVVSLAFRPRFGATEQYVEQRQSFACSAGLSASSAAAANATSRASFCRESSGRPTERIRTYGLQHPVLPEQASLGRLGTLRGWQRVLHEPALKRGHARLDPGVMLPRIQMICSSVNRSRFSRPSPLR